MSILDPPPEQQQAEDELTAAFAAARAGGYQPGSAEMQALQDAQLLYEETAGSKLRRRIGSGAEDEPPRDDVSGDVDQQPLLGDGEAP